jgi:hypothetical protein
VKDKTAEHTKKLEEAKVIKNQKRISYYEDEIKEVSLYCKELSENEVKIAANETKIAANEAKMAEEERKTALFKTAIAEEERKTALARKYIAIYEKTKKITDLIIGRLPTKAELNQLIAIRDELKQLPEDAQANKVIADLNLVISNMASSRVNK